MIAQDAAEMEGAAPGAANAAQSAAGWAVAASFAASLAGAALGAAKRSFAPKAASFCSAESAKTEKKNGWDGWAIAIILLADE